ncbi:acyl carrier protein [Algoriphagus antarcticus]|uniref:Acyl carrier protein n=1 Tax=Algoriphagus antarcticus TaxID=238540 RepID=A0A3E0E8K4_9BACT|nr:acyl carrier protein [Algoriphagus antarcticus]REG94578.1 acyl carrier protein [Algoriphagus antarcticus]
MGKYSQLRKITQVFNEYGIVLTGARKHDHFIFDLRMDKIFLNGLIFELEYALEKELEDHKVIAVDAPSQLIAMLID